MIQMNYDKTEAGRNFVKVTSNEAILIDAIGENAVDGDEPIYCEVGEENGLASITVFDVTDEEFDVIYKAARGYVDSLNAQMAQVDAESEFPNY